MQALATLGVLAATPLVVQFLLQAALTEEQRKKLDDRIKIVLSVLTGGVLAVLLSLYTEAWFLLTGIQQVWVVLNGLIDGAMGAGAMGIGLKVAERMSSTTIIRNQGAENVEIHNEKA